MIKKKAVLGGEGNGGVIDPAIPSLGRDSLASMAYALKQVQTHNLPFSEIVKNNVPKTYMVKKSIPATNKNITAVTKVKGIAFVINFLSPGLKDLSNSKIRVIECLIE